MNLRLLPLFSPPIAFNGDLTPMLGFREPVSGLTHLAGALIALLGGLVLVRRCRGDRAKQVSMAIYAGSLVLLLAASATYHLLDLPQAALRNFRRADHAAIFLLIAGTYTPFYVNAVGGRWRLGNLVMIWTVAILGIALKIAWIDMPDAASAGLYVGMGWLAVFSYSRFASVLPRRAMALVALGGVLYTVGAAADTFEWPVPFPRVFGFHETFHVLVILAAATHFAVILQYVAPLERPVFRARRRQAAAAAA